MSFNAIRENKMFALFIFLNLQYGPVQERFRCLPHQRAAKAQASLCIYASTSVFSRRFSQTQSVDIIEYIPLAPLDTLE